MPMLQIEVKQDTLKRMGILAADQGRDRETLINEALTDYLQWYEGQLSFWGGMEISICDSSDTEPVASEDTFSWLVPDCV